MDGKLIFAAEEERYTRHKHSIAEPPHNSLVEALRHLGTIGIKPGDVDAFALNFDSKYSPLSRRASIYVNSVSDCLGWNAYLDSFSAMATKVLPAVISGFNSIGIAEDFLKKVYSQLGETFPARTRIIPVMHHLAHAA
jgi:carbamoyltransferase